MGGDQGVVLLPPREIASFPAQEANHLQHVVNLGRSQRRLERWHSALSFGDDPSNLAIAFALYRLTKVRWWRWQGRRNRPVAAAAWAMAVRAPLTVDQVHALIAAAAGDADKEKQRRNQANFCRHVTIDLAQQKGATN